GRFLSLALTALSTILVFLVARLGAGRRVGLLAALFFVALPVLIHKTFEIRPDVPALTFFIGALWGLRHGLRAGDEGRRRRAWFVGAGLGLGAAVRCRPQRGCGLPGGSAGLGLWVLGAVGRGGRGRSLSRTAATLVVLLGVAAPVALTWLGFALRGAGAAF